VIFSIITPSLNQAAFLPDCIASVGADGNSIEHLVIDAASTDSTVSILRANPHIRWVSEPDRGQAHAINKGLAMSTGGILAYLCADDLYEPGALEKVRTAFEKNPDADVVHADFFFLEASGKKRMKRCGPFSPERLAHGNFLGQPAVWWRRRVYEKFGSFRHALALHPRAARQLSPARRRQDQSPTPRRLARNRPHAHQGKIPSEAVVELLEHAGMGPPLLPRKTIVVFQMIFSLTTTQRPQRTHWLDF
jgi:glycosyltransferase involved in cell wall biosynthesis